MFKVPHNLPDFYFSFEANPGVGFTDNLNQFRAIYLLGTAMGGVYVHQDMVGKRSPHKLYEFIGLKDFADSIDAPKFEGFKHSVLTFGPKVMGTENIEGICKRLATAIKKQTKVTNGKVIIIMRIRADRRVISSLYRVLENCGKRLNFFELYCQQREKDNWRSIFLEPGLRIYVHIRQGDTAAIPLPFGGFISVWRADEHYMKLVKSSKEMERSYLRPSSFASFLKQLDEYLLIGSRQVCVFSDGFSRGVKRLLKSHESEDAPAFTESEWEQLIEQLPRLDDVEYRTIKEIEGLRLSLGEHDEGMFELVDSSLEADIMVIGPQQRMTQKLLATFRDHKRPRILLIIAEGKFTIDHFEDFGGLPEALQTIYVDLTKLNMNKLIQDIDHMADELGIEAWNSARNDN